MGTEPGNESADGTAPAGEERGVTSRSAEDEGPTRSGRATRAEPETDRGPDIVVSDARSTSDATTSRVRSPRRPRSPRPFRAALRREVVAPAGLGVLALLCVGLVFAVVQKTQVDAAAAAREAAAYTPPPIDPVRPVQDLPVVAVVSDETATRAASSVSAAERWPQVLEGALAARVDVASSTGAGYVAEGSDGASFVDLVGALPPDARVVLFVGGAADSPASPLSVAKAATGAFSAAAQRVPGASIVVVGPFQRAEGATSAEDRRLRAALRSSARIAGVRWIDPQQSEWLGGTGSTTVSPVSAQRAIAARMRSVVESAGG